MSLSIDHVLLTRFNLPSPGAESLVRAKDGWLRDRQVLFERHCLPSVIGQSEKNFSWIIYFDTQSPDWLKEKISELSQGGAFIPIFRDSVSDEERHEDLCRVTGAKGEVLLTTNLDNDDGLAVDFIHRLQEAVASRNRTVIYVENGLICHAERIYLRHDPKNAFCSVSESWDDPVTCWSGWHNLLEEQMPALRLPGAPGWLQVVHTGNVSNRIRGKLVSPSKYGSLFSDGLDQFVPPKSSEIVMDRLVLGPGRSIRDFLRTVAKSVVMKAGGQRGLESVKFLVAWRPSQDKRTGVEQ